MPSFIPKKNQFARVSRSVSVTCGVTLTSSNCGDTETTSIVIDFLRLYKSNLKALYKLLVVVTLCGKVAGHPPAAAYQLPGNALPHISVLLVFLGN